jgi:thioredoxin 1
MAKDITAAEFEADVLTSSKPVLVDFWAEWCGPCRMVSPIVDQIGEEHGAKLDVVKLNVDNEPSIAMKYGITGIPALLVFKDGEVVKSIVGAKPKAALEADLAAFIN